MLLLDVEDRVLEGFLFRSGVTPWDADSMRRLPPVHRNLFDSFLFRMTRVAVGEGDWSTFPHACRVYLAAVGDALERPPPLIPPDVAATVAELLSQFRWHKPGEKFVDESSRVTEPQQQLAKRLFYALGGDHGDGFQAAGLRVYSKMISGRISDGFVHPAVGGHIWGDVSAGPPYRANGGPHIRILRTIEALSRQWESSPAGRPKIERMILDRAHTRGWRTESPGMVEVSPGRWYATPPSAAD